MKQIITAFVHYEQDYKGQPLFSIWPLDMSQTGKVLVCKNTFEVDIPEGFDPITEQVSLLKKERELVRAEMSRKLMQIDDQIAKLMCIEYMPEAA